MRLGGLAGAVISLGACSQQVTVAESAPPSAASSGCMVTGAGVELVGNVRGPRGIALGAGRAFVTSFGDHGIYALPLTGGVGAKVASADWPTYVSVDGTSVFWTDLARPPLLGSVGRVAIAGGSPSLLADQLKHPNSAALVAGDVCFASETAVATSIECVARTGGARQVIGDSDVSPSYVATNSSHVCWTRAADGGSIVCRPRASGAPIEIARDQLTAGAFRMLVADEQNAYWVLRRGVIRKAPLSGGGVAELAAADVGETATNDLVVDVTHVYWIGPHGSSAAVRKIAKSGGTVVDLAIETGQPMGVAVDATHVYWTATPACVKRVLK